MIHAEKNIILVINTGSSSVKFQLFLQHPNLPLLAKGQICNLGNSPLFIVTMETNDPQHRTVKQGPLLDKNTHEEAIHSILHWIEAQNQHWHISLVAHRVVHGGLKFTTSVKITEDVLSELWAFSALAPLHQSHNLRAIIIISEQRPDVLQVACFDTAFHAHHDALFTEYALPQKLRDHGIRRYGFHGLSYEWIVHSMRHNEPKLAEGRIIAAHLGNGASLCAIDNGVSIDTTMGMTALDGLPMGSRCGNLDPGAVIYMIRELGLSADEVESILYSESGLLGLSEWTNDVSLLQGSDKPKARFALNYFCLRTAQLMGMMAVALGGIDCIVFTGGIGENSDFVRSNILNRLAFLQPFATRIIPANEERIMAMHSIALIKRT
jgi:acetate kinase